MISPSERTPQNRPLLLCKRERVGVLVGMPRGLRDRHRDLREEGVGWERDRDRDRETEQRERQRDTQRYTERDKREVETG